MYNKKRTRMFSLIISLLIIFSISVPVFGEASDIAGHWAEKEITKWTGNGIISGYPDGTFKPNASITRAEFVALISRIFDYIAKSDKVFPDVSSKDWYADTVSKAVASGIIVGDSAGNFRPLDPISREEAAVVLYKAFSLKAENVNAADKFADKASISSWSKAAISALVEKSYVSGRPGNLFAPKANITRAEAAKMIDNIANELRNAEGTYEDDISGNLVVSASGIVLKDITIDGDLYLAQGIGDGDVTLDGVTVKGRTVVLGGGENSIILKNTSLQGTMLVMKYDGKIRIVASGSTKAADIQLASGAKLQEEDLTGEGFGKLEIIEVPAGSTITLDGDFEEVKVASKEVVVDVIGGKVADLQVEKEAAGAKISIAEKASVATLTVSAAVEVKGKGTIETANIKAPDVVIEQKPEKVNVDKDITANVGGEEVKGEDTTPVTPPTGGGGYTPAVAVSNIKMDMTAGGSIDAKLDNSIILSDLDDTDRVSGISFTVNPANSTLNLTKIKIGSEELGISISKEFTDTDASVSIRELFGDLLNPGQESVSMASLRGLPGTEVTVIGTLSASGYLSYPVSITVILGDGAGDTNITTAWADISVDKALKTVTATIKTGKEDILVKNVSAISLLDSLTGSPASEVSVGGTVWVSLEKDIKSTFENLGGTAWDSLNLGRLKGKTLKFKKSGEEATIYTLNIV